MPSLYFIAQSPSKPHSRDHIGAAGRRSLQFRRKGYRVYLVCPGARAGGKKNSSYPHAGLLKRCFCRRSDRVGDCDPQLLVVGELPQRRMPKNITFHY